MVYLFFSQLSQVWHCFGGELQLNSSWFNPLDPSNLLIWIRDSGFKNSRVSNSLEHDRIGEEKTNYIDVLLRRNITWKHVPFCLDFFCDHQRDTHNSNQQVRLKQIQPTNLKKCSSKNGKFSAQGFFTSAWNAHDIMEVWNEFLQEESSCGGFEVSVSPNSSESTKMFN